MSKQCDLYKLESISCHCKSQIWHYSLIHADFEEGFTKALYKSAGKGVIQIWTPSFVSAMNTTIAPSLDGTCQYTPGQTRTRPLEVLSLGFPRTGTKSMAMALETMGYGHCAHGFDIMDSPDYAARLEKAVDAHFFNRGERFTRFDWDALLGHCGAITDMPLVGFWKELCEAYPDAKIVLVERDEDSWYKSLSEAVIEPFFTPTSNFTRLYLEPLLGSRLGHIAYKSLCGFLQAKDETGMKAKMRRLYRQHYKEIREAIPKERILEYELGSGWGPLCEFLGKPARKTVFPRVNETDAVKEMFEVYKRKRLAELFDRARKGIIPAILLAMVVLFALLSPF